MTRLEVEVRRHVLLHGDWLRGRCRFVWSRSFPFAGFEYPLRRELLDPERDPELVS